VNSKSTKSHLLTIGLTDFYHAGALKRAIHRRHWPRFETRIEQNTLRTLDLLDRCDSRATFFTMGWVARRQADLIREVSRRGHEIANLGYYDRSVGEMTRSEFEEDLKRSQDAIENASGLSIVGYRSARPLFRARDLWILDVLATAGYKYDSSIFPLLRSFKSEPWRRFPHQHQCGSHMMWEFPWSTWKCFGYALPIAGGNYFRQFPHFLMKKGVTAWGRTYDMPFVMYFHVWDLDPGQPQISSASTLARIRAYRNLDKMAGIIEDYLQTYRFESIANYLGIGGSCQELPSTRSPTSRMVKVKSVPFADRGAVSRSQPATDKPTKTGLTIVVPCFNEQPVLPYLRNTLRSVKKSMDKNYDVHFILVDDGSTDETWQSLQRSFGTEANTQLLQHVTNRGVTAAILSGLQAAHTELVCSIDCDCTYDPHELEKLVPRLTEGVDLVTGSPYHPQGVVLNVPGWRLKLSKTASFLYRCVLRNKLHTYTSCFRVYRRSVVTQLDIHEDGFLGVAELIAKLDLQGSKIEECPTTLEVRVLGHSKMKTARTIIGHLLLLAKLLMIRIGRPISVKHVPLGVVETPGLRTSSQTTTELRQRIG
jgi:polysaccharide deacetylase family protein (PEP-CTERM system associated)